MPQCQHHIVGGVVRGGGGRLGEVRGGEVGGAWNERGEVGGGSGKGKLDVKVTPVVFLVGRHKGIQ